MSLDRSEVFDKLAQADIETVTLEFSGGNDEGGVDDISAIKRDGSEFVVEIWHSENNDAPFDDEFINTLSDPIYDKWGSFAGEFHVYGKLVWNVDTRTVVLDGNESVETYTGFNEIL